MKILCVSDTTKSLAFSPMVASVFPETDLVISAGDMPLVSYDYLSTMLRADVFYVYGNHNLEHYSSNSLHDAMKGENGKMKCCPFYGFMVDGKCIHDKNSGLLIAGLGGSMKYNEGESQFSEREMRHRIWKMLPKLWWNKLRYGRYLDILVTHAAPYGLGDEPDLCHRGFRCFLSFMKKYQPKYLLHGHIHLVDGNAPRIKKYEKTTVINVYGAYVLDDDQLGEKK